LGNSEVDYLVFHPTIGLGFQPADSITGCNSAKIEPIKKRLLLAFLKQSNSFCIGFSITILSELNPFSSLLSIDHNAFCTTLEDALFTGCPSVFCYLSMGIVIFGLGAGLNAGKGTFHKLIHLRT
jgi:hypothetical protein